MSQAAPLLIVQITDTHLYATDTTLFDCSTRTSFNAVVEKIKSLQPQPDLLLLTGDISQDETVESYEYLQTQLEPLGISTYWLPGNHDIPHLMNQILGKKPFSNQKSLQIGNWQLILLNSAVAGKVEGYLCLEELKWLNEQLQQNSDRPTLIAVHHHPLDINSAWMDKFKLQYAEDLFSILEIYSQVRLVIFGHIHQEFSQKYQNIDYFACPSTCVQFIPNSPELMLDTLTPGFRLITLQPDGNFTTQVQRI
jgi:3',5'-cyclic-AMP phosphodiesterase